MKENESVKKNQKTHHDTGERHTWHYTKHRIGEPEKVMK
jgi:hypothetical protein